MIGLDTNLLVRFATHDDADQYRTAEKLLREVRDTGQRCFLNHVVLCELVWTLRRQYRYSRHDIVATIEMLASIPEFELDNRRAIYLALANYKTGRGDFSDYLIGHINAQHGATPTATFDRGRRDSPLFRVLD